MKPSATAVFNSLLLILINLAVAPVACAYYDPGIQRWMNRDPIQDSGFENVRRNTGKPTHSERNLFAYVSNDAISHVDPLGLWKFKNCTEEQKDQITAGLKAKCDAAKQSNCFNCLSRGNKIAMNKMCDNSATGLDEITFECADATTDPNCKNADGYSYPASRVSSICFPSSEATGGLGCVALHEASHSVGRVGDDNDPKAKSYDPNAYDIGQCAGCPRTPGF